jgi:N-formylglutamate deformylase
MKNLPFLISIPHGGTKTPPELVKCVSISKKDLFDDTDAFSGEIYDVSGLVEKVLRADIARAFIDLSRDVHMVPPQYPDGIIKSMTCYGKQIYRDGFVFDEKLKKKLINKYYTPYHKAIQQAISTNHIKLGLDCHTMAATGPAISPDKGKQRPLINIGDNEGNAAPSAFSEILRKSFITVFGFAEKDVTINQPFKGGYITRGYGNNPVPWLQIEMNRKLYLSPEWFNEENQEINPGRLSYLNNHFRDVLIKFYSQLIQNTKHF